MVVVPNGSWLKDMLFLLFSFPCVVARHPPLQRPSTTLIAHDAHDVLYRHFQPARPVRPAVSRPRLTARGAGIPHTFWECGRLGGCCAVPNRVNFALSFS